MKRLKSFFVLFLTVLLNVYFVNTLVWADESGEVIIEGTLTTDKENYTSQDSITITLEAKNNGASTTSYESEIVVLDGYVLADNNSNKKAGSLDAGTADSLVVTIVPESKTGSNTNEQEDNHNPAGQTTSGQSQQPGKGKGSNTGVQNNKTIWLILGTAGALGIISLAIKGKKGKETLSIILCLALAGSIVAANTNQVKAEGYDQEVKVATNVTIDGKTAEINGVIRFNSANQPTPDPQPVVDIPQETFIKDFNPDDVIELEPGIEIMKGEILVITDNEEALKEEVAKHDGKVVGHISGVNVYQVEFPKKEAKDLETLKSTFESYDWVKDASLDYLIEPEDYDYQLPDDYPTDNSQYAYEAVEAPKAWELIDDIGTENLYQPKIGIFECENADFSSMNDIKMDNYYPTDVENGIHGFLVAGIISAQHNSQGIPGMFPDANLTYYTITEVDHVTTDGREVRTMIEVDLKLIEYIESVKDQPAVINMSFGYSTMSVDASNGVQSAIDELNEFNENYSVCLQILSLFNYDFLIVKAAGNNSEALAYWDVFSGIEDQEIKDRIIVVGSSKPGNKSIESSTYHSNGDRVDIIAPGENAPLITGSNQYGTSLSTPFVTGTVAMLLSINPDLSGKDLKRIILETGSGQYYIDNKSDPVPHLNSYEAVKRVFNDKFHTEEFEKTVPSITSFSMSENKINQGDFCSYKVEWDEVEGAFGYEVSYSNASDDKEEIIKTGELFAEVPVHSEDDNMTVKVRAFQEIYGKKFYTQWSDPVTKSSEDIKKEYKEMSTGGFTSIVPVIGEWTNATVWNDTGIGSIEYRVDWSPVEGAEGYEFFYNFELTVNPEHTVETDDTYYTVGFQNQVNLNGQVRAYKTVNGERIYTQWSNTSYKDWATIDQECKALAEANTPTTSTGNENWTIKRTYQSDPSVPEFTDEEIEERLRWLGVPEDVMVTVTVDAPYYGDSVNPNGYMQFIEARSDDGSFASASFAVGGDLYQARTIHSYSR